MKINQLDSTPRNIRYEDEFESHMTSEIADDVIENGFGMTMSLTKNYLMRKR